MIERGRRVLSFAGQHVGLEWSGDDARRVADLAAGSGDAGDDVLPDEIFRLGVRDEPRLVTLFRGRSCLYRGDSLGAAAHLLLQAALDALIEPSEGGLVLHAALLARGADGILLPGPTAAGKTMLAAWLARRGLAPLADEAVYLADGESTLRAFARPFCFKGEWGEALGLDVPGDVLRGDGVSLAPAGLFNSAAAPRAVAPRLLVFPRFEAGAAFSLTPLTPARAAVRLMQSVANARNLADHGVGRVTALVRSLEAYGLTYGGFEQLPPLLRLIGVEGS